MYEELVVVALGGNAIKQSAEKGTTEESRENKNDHPMGQV